MQSSSPTFSYPKTPAHNRNPLQFRPINSSPLVTSPESPKSSPVAAAQARRKSQYKAQFPVTPPSNTRSVSNTRHASRTLFFDKSSRSVEEDPQKVFLRDRFKARCIERAVKAREKAVRGRRYYPSSDDYHMDDDEEEDDEVIMQDELFRRIVANASRKEKHSYKVSYAQEVGSSFDPDMEDISSWEQELAASGSGETSRPIASISAGPISSDLEWLEDEEEEPTPADLDDEEIMAYAEECARRAALEEFEDIPVEELFKWDDEDLDTPAPSSTQLNDTMDMS